MNFRIYFSFLNFVRWSCLTFNSFSILCSSQYTCLRINFSKDVRQKEKGSIQKQKKSLINDISAIFDPFFIFIFSNLYLSFWIWYKCLLSAYKFNLHLFSSSLSTQKFVYGRKENRDTCKISPKFVVIYLGILWQLKKKMLQC